MMKTMEEFRKAAGLGVFTPEGIRLKRIQTLLEEYHETDAAGQGAKLKEMLDVLREYITGHPGGIRTNWAKYSATVALWTEAVEELTTVHGQKPDFALLDDERFIAWDDFQQAMNVRSQEPLTKKPSRGSRRGPAWTALGKVVGSEAFQALLDMEVGGKHGTSWRNWLADPLPPTLRAPWQWADKRDDLNELALAQSGKGFPYAFYFEIWSCCEAMASGAELAMAMDEAFPIAWKVAEGLRAAASPRADEGFDAYKMDLALLHYLADVALNSGGMANEKVLIEALGTGKDGWACQARVQRIATTLLCGLDVSSSR